jgi:hypothetical protein
LITGVQSEKDRHYIDNRGTIREGNIELQTYAPLKIQRQIKTAINEYKHKI